MNYDFNGDANCELRAREIFQAVSSTDRNIFMRSVFREALEKDRRKQFHSVNRSRRLVFPLLGRILPVESLPKSLRLLKLLAARQGVNATRV